MAITSSSRPKRVQPRLGKQAMPLQPGMAASTGAWWWRCPPTTWAGPAGCPCTDAGRVRLYDILAERKPVSPEVAVRLAKLFGNAPLVWISMQGAHDAWHAAREVDVSGVPTLFAAE